METYCLPILMYASGAVYLDATRSNEINSWWNSVYRKIFYFNKWESVSELILLLERLDYNSLYMLRKCKFIKSMSCSHNAILSYIMPFYLHAEEFMCFCGRSRLNIRMSVPKIKHILFNRMHIKVCKLAIRWTLKYVKLLYHITNFLNCLYFKLKLKYRVHCVYCKFCSFSFLLNFCWSALCGVLN